MILGLKDKYLRKIFRERGVAVNRVVRRIKGNRFYNNPYVKSGS